LPVYAREALAEYCKAHNGKSGEISIVLADETPRYFQHKYYRGYLLPAIADESFSGDREIAHAELKKILLQQPVSGWEEIPKKHRARASVIFIRSVLDAGEVHDLVRGYIPSTACLSVKEMAEYILKVEALCAEYGIQVSLPNVAAEYRRKALGKAA
jgi:hypothetical protein